MLDIYIITIYTRRYILTVLRFCFEEKKTDGDDEHHRIQLQLHIFLPP